MQRFFTFSFILLPLFYFATHQRAGEITYKCVNGGYRYEITVITYSNSCSIADDDEIEVNFGDGYNDMAPRINGNGDSLGVCLKKNIYRINHDYPGPPPSYYRITVELLNRKGFIVNVPNSIGTPLFLESRLFFSPLPPLQTNASVQFYYPPLDTACIGYCFTHIPGAHDPDGDSLRFELINCLGTGGLPVPGYFIPAGTTLDPRTGELLWCSPYAVPNFTFPQEWNFAFIVHEYRFYNGNWIKVGHVERDMQVTVVNCGHTPPNISPINDVCVLEGNTATVTVTASDPQDMITLSAYGAPFNLMPPATFTSTPSTPTVTGIFSWTPSCEQVRKQPFQVVVKATDNNTNVNLTDLESFLVYVIAKAPDNLSGTNQQCNNMTLAWDSSLCDPVMNRVIGYRVFIDDFCNPWNPAACETSVPAYTGYTQVAYVAGKTNTSILIPNLSYGVYYSFRVVTEFRDGAFSRASDPICLRLDQATPVITHVDVTLTDNLLGIINLRWTKPPVGPGGYDTLMNPGPYVCRIYRGMGYSNPTTAIANIYSQYYSNLNTVTWLDDTLNTSDTAYVYRVDLISSAAVNCSATAASSVYLRITPSDNVLTLNWNYDVPWNNYLFYIWKEIPTGSGNWFRIDTVSTNTFRDINLVNGANYCYYIESEGVYSDPSIIAPLLNRSEIKCGTPIDLTAPCAPTLSISSECEVGYNQLSWTNPNLSCADDVVAYHIYYAPIEGMDPFLIATISPATNLTFQHDSMESVAGCYYITAIDSFNNESPVSNRICIDNCPEYILPNVFTPNGDGTNDFFIPLPYRDVKKIDFKIFNRWGELVFATADPGIHWDGRSLSTGDLCSDGVYFYTCDVFEIHLYGIEIRSLKGFVHIIGSK